MSSHEGLPFKRYQSVKQVDATPMTDKDYNQALIKIPDYKKKSNGGVRISNPYTVRDGYMVIYNRGQPGEFISWTPKDEFEMGNAEVKIPEPKVPEKVEPAPVYLTDAGVRHRDKDKHDDLDAVVLCTVEGTGDKPGDTLVVECEVLSDGHKGRDYDHDDRRDHDGRRDRGDGKEHQDKTPYLQGDAALAGLTASMSHEKPAETVQPAPPANTGGKMVVIDDDVDEEMVDTTPEPEVETEVEPEPEPEKPLPGLLKEILWTMNEINEVLYGKAKETLTDDKIAYLTKWKDKLIKRYNDIVSLEHPTITIEEIKVSGEPWVAARFYVNGVQDPFGYSPEFESAVLSCPYWTHSFSTFVRNSGVLRSEYEKFLPNGATEFPYGDHEFMFSASYKDKQGETVTIEDIPVMVIPHASKLIA